MGGGASGVGGASYPPPLYTPVDANICLPDGTAGVAPPPAAPPKKEAPPAPPKDQGPKDPPKAGKAAPNASFVDDGPNYTPADANLMLPDGTAVKAAAPVPAKPVEGKKAPTPAAAPAPADSADRKVVKAALIGALKTAIGQGYDLSHHQIEHLAEKLLTKVLAKGAAKGLAAKAVPVIGGAIGVYTGGSTFLGGFDNFIRGQWKIGAAKIVGGSLELAGGVVELGGAAVAITGVGAPPGVGMVAAGKGAGYAGGAIALGAYAAEVVDEYLKENNVPRK